MNSCRECGGPLVPIKDITAWCPNCREADIADDLCQYITELEAENKRLKELEKIITDDNEREFADVVLEVASLRTTLAQVREWAKVWLDEGDPMNEMEDDLLAILSTDNEVLAVVEANVGLYSQGDLGYHYVEAVLPTTVKRGDPVTVTVTRRLED